MNNRDISAALPHAVFAVASASLAAVHASRTVARTEAALVESWLPLLLAGVIGYAGWRFSALEPTRRQVAVAGGLLCGGGLYGAGFVAFIQWLQSLSGIAMAYPHYMVAMAGVGGVAMATVIAHFYVGYTQRVAQARSESVRARRLQKQASVLNRILRHNLRNELQVIDGWLGAAVGRGNVDPEKGYAVVQKHIDELQDASERARLIEQVLRTDERASLDIVASVERAAASVDGEVTVETAPLERAPAVAHPEVETAVQEALENAVEHNDGTDLAVDVSVSLAGDADRAWRIDIADTGGGIPAVELDALRGDAEGPLEHGQGLGLYLIQTIVEQSDGDLSIRQGDAGDAGTTVRMEFPVAERDQRRDAGPRTADPGPTGRLGASSD